MSTIAARAHSGAVLTAPAKRAAPPRRKAPWMATLARGIGRRPGRSLTFLVFGAVASLILSNALFLQKARHPAPMLSAPAQVPQARSAEPRADSTPQQASASTAAPSQPSMGASAPIPPARPSDLVQAARETGNRPPAAVTSVPRNTPAPAAQRAAVVRDPIADLINGGDIRPPGEIRGGAAKSASARRSAEN